MKAAIPPDTSPVYSRHLLLVEGTSSADADSASLDSAALEPLLPRGMAIRPLGPATNIEAAATAHLRLFPHHCFLIDRDYHRSDADVDASWSSFQAGEKNILIWSRKELENYLLDPTLLGLIAPPRRRKSSTEIAAALPRIAARRLHLEVANYVLIDLRESAKNTGIRRFRSSAGIHSVEDALSAFEKLNWHGAAETVAKAQDPAYLRARLEERLELLTGGCDTLQIGRGRWQELLPGKKILHQLVADCFSSDKLSGDALYASLAREAVSVALSESRALLPPDFIKLQKLLEARLN